MKTVFSKLVAAGCLVLLTMVIGCGRNNSTTDSISPAAPGQPVVVTAEGQTGISHRATNAFTEAGDKAAGEAGSKVESIIERAKTLVGQARWADALALLESLKGQALQPEQVALVQSLKQQAQQKIELGNKTVDGVLKTP